MSVGMCFSAPREETKKQQELPFGHFLLLLVVKRDERQGGLFAVMLVRNCQLLAAMSAA